MITHSELCIEAAKWLIKEMGCPIVLPEAKVYMGEQPDVIGFFDGGDSILIECKTSRADFKGDKNKQYRWHPNNGMGDYRIYAVTENVIRREDEIPENWGWMYFNGKSFRIVVEPQKFEVSKKEMEISLLVAAIRNRTVPVGIDNDQIKIGTRKISFMKGNIKNPKYEMHPEIQAEYDRYEKMENEREKSEREEKEEDERLIKIAQGRLEEIHRIFEEEKEFMTNYNRDYPQPDGKFRSVSVYF
jgi:hypothetical protein